MDQTGLTGKIPISLVSLIDSLDTSSKLLKTLKLKVLCSWKYLTEKNLTSDSASVREFNTLVESSHKKLWEVDKALLNWYDGELVKLAKDSQLQAALKSFTTDSEYKTIKNSIWGTRVITEVKVPKVQKVATIKESISNELTPLFDHNVKQVAFDIETPESLRAQPFKQVKVVANNPQNLRILKVFESAPNERSIPISGNDNLRPLEEIHTCADIQRKKICYLRRRDKEWFMYLVTPTNFDKDQPETTEVRIEKSAVQGFVQQGEQGPIAVFDCEVSASAREVRIMRLDTSRNQSVWGENLNKSSTRELVNFAYRRQHGVIVLKQSNKYSAIFFNDKCATTLDYQAPGYFDCDLFEQPRNEKYLSSHIYFKANGLPFPYFVHVFESFVLVNYYSNNRGAAYVSIRSQRLEIGDNAVSANWTWTQSDRYEAVERLVLEFLPKEAAGQPAGARNVRLLVKF